MADIITNLPLKDFMSFHREKGGIASITLKDVSQPRAYGVIMLNQDSLILLFLEKPHPEELSLATLTFSLKCSSLGFISLAQERQLLFLTAVSIYNILTSLSLLFFMVV